MAELTAARQAMIECAMPDWVRAGGYAPNSAQAKTEALLRDLAARTADTYLNALAGKYAIVALTDPCSIDPDGCHRFGDGSAAGEVAAAPGTGIIYHDLWEWTPDQAEEIARQWLSAADCARTLTPINVAAPQNEGAL
jgi:hypothetical protein